MTRLPVPGSDDGLWGELLNSYLLVSHDASGALNSGVVGDTQVSSLSQGKISGLATTLTAKEDTANKGQASGYASLDAGAKIPIAQVPTGATGSTVALGNHTHTATFTLSAFTKQGSLAIATGTLRLPIDGTYTVTGVRLMVGTAPVGADLIVDVNKNGTTIFTTQPNRPTITAGSNSGGPGTAPDVTSLAAGDYLTIDIDQVGSSTAGSDLVVSVIVTRSF